MLNRDMDIRDVPGFEPQVPIRWGNSAPGKAAIPGGERAPRKPGGGRGRRPHGGGDGQRHAHAGAKTHGGPREGARKPADGRRRGGGGPRRDAQR